jgi:hypothetical protein
MKFVNDKFVYGFTIAFTVLMGLISLAVFLFATSLQGLFVLGWLAYIPVVFFVLSATFTYYYNHKALWSKRLGVGMYFLAGFYGAYIVISMLGSMLNGARALPTDYLWLIVITAVSIMCFRAASHLKKGMKSIVN